MLEEIKSRLAGATNGPWLIDDKEQTVRSGYAGTILFDRSADPSTEWWEHDRSDAEFIAHAPEDIAKLVAFVEEMVEMMHDLDEVAEELQPTHARDAAAMRIITKRIKDALEK